MSVAARTVDDLLGLRRYYEAEIRKIDDMLQKQRENYERERKLFRSECEDEGVEFGTPLEEYPKRLQRKMWAIGERYRRVADPLEKRRDTLLRKLIEVKQAIEQTGGQNVNARRDQSQTMGHW